MTHTTPQEARETADHLEHMPRLYAGAACNALRSLAAQIEAITAERDACKLDAARWRLLSAAYSTDFHDIGLIRLLNQAALDAMISHEAIAKEAK